MAEGNSPIVLVAGTFASKAGAEMVYGRMSQMLDASIVTLSRLGTASTQESVDKVARTLESPSILVGHSQGGLVATALAFQHPELVKGVVSLGAPFYGTRLASPLLPFAGLRNMSRWNAPIMQFATRPLTVPVVSVAGMQDELIWPRSSALLCGSEQWEFPVGHMGLVSDPRVLEWLDARVGEMGASSGEELTSFDRLMGSWGWVAA